MTVGKSNTVQGFLKVRTAFGLFSIFLYYHVIFLTLGAVYIEKFQPGLGFHPCCWRLSIVLGTHSLLYQIKYTQQKLLEYQSDTAKNNELLHPEK